MSWEMLENLSVIINKIKISSLTTKNKDISLVFTRCPALSFHLILTTIPFLPLSSQRSNQGYRVQLALWIRGFHIRRLNQPQIENIWKKKIPESSKKQNLNFLHSSNYLHSIHIVLCIISNLEMI